MERWEWPYRCDDPEDGVPLTEAAWAILAAGHFVLGDMLSELGAETEVSL